mgnify:CR=1 FL=1
MIDMPPGWSPQPSASVDPQLKTDLSEIKEHPPTQQEYMPKIVEQLKTCYDPEIPVNIYELGLIYNIEIIDTNVKIKMTLTTPNCPVAESLPKEVKEGVMQVEGIEDVDLELVWDPPWNKDMMSEAAKLEMNL